MKLIFSVLFVCCLAVALVESSDDKSRKRQIAVEECRKDLNLTDEDAKNPPRLGYYKSGCFYACIQKKLGYLSEHGGLNRENIILGSNDPNSKEVSGAITGCALATKGETCELAWCLENSKDIFKQ